MLLKNVFNKVSAKDFIIFITAANNPPEIKLDEGKKKSSALMLPFAWVGASNRVTDLNTINKKIVEAMSLEGLRKLEKRDRITSHTQEINSIAINQTVQ